MSKHQFSGSCHCGNISYQFHTDQTIKDFGIRKCDCSFCAKSGSRYISDPNGELLVKIKNESRVSHYQFGTKTAEFLICTECGGMPLSTCEIEGICYGIVNLNTLEMAEHFGRHAKMMSYDAETTNERLERRKRNWIGTVKIKIS